MICISNLLEILRLWWKRKYFHLLYLFLLMFNGKTITQLCTKYDTPLLYKKVVLIYLFLQFICKYKYIISAIKCWSLMYTQILKPKVYDYGYNCQFLWRMQIYKQKILQRCKKIESSSRFLVWLKPIIVRFRLYNDFIMVIYILWIWDVYIVRWGTFSQYFEVFERSYETNKDVFMWQIFILPLWTNTKYIIHRNGT